MRSIAVTLPAVVLFCSAASYAGEPSTARQDELIYLLRQDCGSCHGMTMKGGLGPSLLPSDIADKTDEGLADTILLGRPGTPMAPWAFEITEEEAYWLIRQLRKGGPSK